MRWMAALVLCLGVIALVNTSEVSEFVQEDAPDSDLYSDLEQLTVEEPTEKTGDASRFLSKELEEAELEDEQFTQEEKPTSVTPSAETDRKLQQQIGSKLRKFVMESKAAELKHEHKVANIKAQAKLSGFVDEQAANVARAELFKAHKKSAKEKAMAAAKAVADRNAMRTKIDIAAFSGKVGDGTGEIIARQMGDLGDEGHRSVSLSGLPKPTQKTVVAPVGTTTAMPVNGMGGVINGVSTKMRTKASSDKDAAKLLLKQKYAKQIKQLKNQLAAGNYR